MGTDPQIHTQRMPSPKYQPDPRHIHLGDEFFDVVSAADFPRHTLRYRNQRWAERAGLGPLTDDEWLRHFAKFEPLPGNLEQPLALRYHGHQFRSYNPDLGDGRGFLFAQLRDGEDGRLLDLGTKGSGQTPWSRGGDGRLTLKGGVREVLATAMLEALGVNTSKSFSLFETGEALMRGDEPSPTRSSVLVRLSHSHIRFGSFQRQAFLRQTDNIQTLLDYSIAHYFPEILELERVAQPAAFLREVVLRSADVAASWIAAGFVHGVLNTDNLNITGESFDYGPYRFLPTLDPTFTAAYFDHSGLYAYARQPEAVAWNLSRLAEALILIAEKDPVVEALETWEASFDAALYRCTLRRLGVRRRVRGSADRSVDSSDASGDHGDFVNALYGFMHDSQVGFEQFFFDWFGGTSSRERAERSPQAEKYRTPQFEELLQHLECFEAVGCAEADATAKAYFQRDRPCTLLIDEIEAIWARIAEADDWSAFNEKLTQIEATREALNVA